MGDFLQDEHGSTAAEYAMILWISGGVIASAGIALAASIALSLNDTAAKVDAVRPSTLFPAT